MHIYSAPNSESEQGQPQPIRRVLLGKIFAALSLLLAASIWGLAVSVWTMFDAFQTVTLNGSGDPKVMAGYISKSLVTATFGAILGGIGFLSALISFYFSSYRAKFYLYFWSVAALAMTLSFPFGTLPGIVLMIILATKRDEFSKK